MKKFLRALKEPVIPHSLWRTFVDAANNPDTTDAETALYQVRYTRQLLILERFMILYNISSNQWNMNLEFAVRFSVTVTSALITNVFFSGRERASTSQSRHPGLPDSPPAEGRGQRRLQDVRRQSLHGHGPHHCRILIQVRSSGHFGRRFKFRVPTFATYSAAP